MQEIWMDIKEYEGMYQISNLGRVKSLPRKGSTTERILKPNKDTKGYNRVILTKNNSTKTFKIHRLVAEYFIPNPDNLPQVNHIDEVKDNNIVTNLEWCDTKYNCNYGHRNDSMKKRVRCIETGVEFDSINEAAKYAGLKNCTCIVRYLKQTRKCDSAGSITDSNGNVIRLTWEYI